MDFRAQLQRSVSAAMVPYGYTLTVAGSTTLGGERLGLPGLGSLLLLIAGASLAIFVIEATARGTLRPRLERPRTIPAPAGWAGIQLVPVACAVLGAQVVLLVLDGPAAWPAIGFVATGTYLTLTALLLAAFGRPARED